MENKKIIGWTITVLMIGIIAGYLICLTLLDIPFARNTEDEWHKECLAGNCSYDINAKTNLVERGFWTRNGEVFEKWATFTENDNGRREVLLYAKTADKGKFALVTEYNPDVFEDVALASFNYEKGKLNTDIDIKVGEDYEVDNTSNYYYTDIESEEGIDVQMTMDIS